MKVYEKAAVKLCLAVIFCQRCLCDEDAKLFTLIGLGGAAQNPSPALEEERKGKKIELIKKMSCESVVLFEYFSTLFMKVRIFFNGHYYFTHNLFFSYRST